MQFSPFLDMCQGSLRKLPIYLSRLDFHGDFKVAVNRVEVRRPMVSIVHGNDDTARAEPQPALRNVRLMRS